MELQQSSKYGLIYRHEGFGRPTLSRTRIQLMQSQQVARMCRFSLIPSACILLHGKELIGNRKVREW